MISIQPPNNDSNRKKRQPFTPQEDLELKKLVEIYGENDWVLISKRFHTKRSSRQCRDRWKEYLMPSLNLNPWTKEEDIQLIQKIKEHGRKWSIIGMFMKGRSETALKNRWRLLERRNFNVKYEEQNKQETFTPRPVIIQQAPQIPKQKFPSLQETEIIGKESVDQFLNSLLLQNNQVRKFPPLTIDFPIARMY